MVFPPQCHPTLSTGEMVEGVLRINPKNYEDAYICAPDRGHDILVKVTLGLHDLSHLSHLSHMPHLSHLSHL